jgi:hypothetical protein
MQKSDSDTLRQIAVKAGMKTLWEDGIDKMLRGLTTADENFSRPARRSRGRVACRIKQSELRPEPQLSTRLSQP